MAGFKNIPITGGAPTITTEVPISGGTPSITTASFGGVSFGQVPTPPPEPAATEFRLTVPGAELARQQENRQLEMATQAVKHHLAPLAYRSLQVGPETVIEYESNLTEPIDGARSMLRNLSPFMIQVEPPLSFGEDGGFINHAKNSIIRVGAYTEAQGAASGYDAARSQLAQSGIVRLNHNAGSAAEVVTKNSSGVQKTSSSDGTKVDNKGQSDNKLGEPAIADMYAAVDIAWQLSAALNTPPLVLLINPHTLSMAINKIQQFQDRTRFGYVFHAWGEDQPRLSISAKCGGFISGQRGYQFSSKRDSAAWQNWMNMYHFYKNNGYIHDTVGKSHAHHHVGALSIHYDGWVYYGSMESFNYSYDEGLQHGGMEFSIEFTVSWAVDTSKPVFNVLPMKSPIPSMSDPRYQGMQARGHNRPGQFSVGFNSDGSLRLSTQGRLVSAQDALSTMEPVEVGKLRNKNLDFQPQDATVIGRKQGLAGQPVGTKGFQDFTSGGDTGTGGRTVTQTNPATGIPFGV